MNKPGKAMIVMVPTCQDTAKLVEPCESAFNLPSSAVALKLSAVLRDGLPSVFSMRSNHFNTTRCQLLIERITVIGTIPDKSSGSSHGDGFIERSFDKGDFMWASRSRVHGDRKTISVCNDHELRTLAPLGLSDFRPPFFATTKVPSIKHSAKLMPPRSSKSCANASSIFRMTPSPTQQEKRLKQVVHDGYRSGRSFQAAPVRNIHSTPFITARLSWIGGLPFPSARRRVSGIKGSRIAHCSSVSSSFLAMQKS
jgi:hypothetical protein